MTIDTVQLAAVGDRCIGDGCLSPVEIIVRTPSGLVGYCRACYNRTLTTDFKSRLSKAGKVGGRSKSAAKVAAARANVAAARAKRWKRPAPVIAMPSPQPAPQPVSIAPAPAAPPPPTPQEDVEETSAVT